MSTKQSDCLDAKQLALVHSCVSELPRQLRAQLTWPGFSDNTMLHSSMLCSLKALLVQGEHHGDLLASCYLLLPSGKPQPGHEGSSRFLP